MLDHTVNSMVFQMVFAPQDDNTFHWWCIHHIYQYKSYFSHQSKACPRDIWDNILYKRTTFSIVYTAFSLLNTNYFAHNRAICMIWPWSFWVRLEQGKNTSMQELRIYVGIGTEHYCFKSKSYRQSTANQSGLYLDSPSMLVKGLVQLPSGFSQVL